MAIRTSKTLLSPTRRADQKRVDILDSASKCFRKNGFHQTSMQEICTEVGLGPGAVYRYFVSKDAIIVAMAETERRQTRAILSEFHDTTDLPQALSAITRVFAQRYAAISDTGLMTEIYAEGLRNKRVSTVIKKAETDWVDGLAAMLRRAQERGQIDAALDVQQAALLLTAMWDGIVIRQAYTQDMPAAMVELFDAMLKRWLSTTALSSKRVKPTARPKPVVAVTAPEFDFTPVSDPVPEPAPEPALAATEADMRQMSLI